VPIFLDRHDLSGLTAADIAEAHRKDLEVQGQYGVRFLTYWFDESRGTGFCLIDAPDIETAMRVHDEVHGDSRTARERCYIRSSGPLFSANCPLEQRDQSSN
jgi:hypothetical protein